MKWEKERPPLRGWGQNWRMERQFMKSCDIVEILGFQFRFGSTLWSSRFFSFGCHSYSEEKMSQSFKPALSKKKSLEWVPVQVLTTQIMPDSGRGSTSFWHRCNYVVFEILTYNIVTTMWILVFPTILLFRCSCWSVDYSHKDSNNNILCETPRLPI